MIVLAVLIGIIIVCLLVCLSGEQSNPNTPKSAVQIHKQIAKERKGTEDKGDKLNIFVSILFILGFCLFCAYSFSKPSSNTKHYYESSDHWRADRFSK